MSKWRGLHNPDRHDPDCCGPRAFCRDCSDADCSEEYPCFCCRLHEARAEVERLTAELADRDRRIEAALVLHWDRHDAFDDRYIDCGVCNRPAPCPTVQALRGESDE